MKRGIQGREVSVSTIGEVVKVFVPNLLPLTSFRFRLAVDTLVLCYPTAKSVTGFLRQVIAHAGRTINNICGKYPQIFKQISGSNPYIFQEERSKKNQPVTPPFTHPIRDALEQI